MSKFEISVPEIPCQPSEHLILGNVLVGADASLIAQIVQNHAGVVCVITTNMAKALSLKESLTSLLNGVEAILFPDWETLPYDHFSPNQDIVSARLTSLYKLQSLKRGVVILGINTLMQRICPPEFLLANALLIKRGDSLNLSQLCEQLAKAGYLSVNQVMSHGEFASRGSLLDLFPMGLDKPLRLDFLDNEIDSIRTFDVDSQRTLEEISEVRLLPAHEFPFNEAGIEQFRTAFRENFSTIRRDDEHVYQQVSRGECPAGIEYLQPLFFSHMATLFAYLPHNTLLVDWQDNYASTEQFYKDIEARYENYKVDPMRPILPPEKLWLRPNELYNHYANYPRVSLQAEKFSRQGGNKKNLSFKPLPDLTFTPKNPLQNLQNFLQQFKGQIIFGVESAGRREILRELLAPLKLDLATIDTQNLKQILANYNLCITPLEQGFILPEDKLAVITERELLGEKVKTTPVQRQAINPDLLIRNLAELKIGQAVVHLDHGIGRYQGLIKLENHGVATEFLLLEYADNAKLYVPVANLHLISRYVNGNEEQVSLHKLGGDQWSKARAKALEKIRDVAAELLDVYAQRESKSGFKFHYDQAQFQEFANSFAFEETQDQKQAINAVISDMTQERAMDRLICGDVGFGKTEVAIRASFLAVMNQKQVVMLVPTTLLAKQHYETLRDRFADQAVNVAMLSRFNSSQENQQILQDLEAGKIDILVGTHKLLQKDVKFKDLGLLIIDEEHRFGVQQKERIKTLRANVDILTLTATPIPRTLNMAMNGIRDISIIATPPARRLTVKTFVHQKEDALIREAILREILRGGQVYYLHNDVASIENCAENLAKIVPEVRIQIGHGQMAKRQLERVMTDFHHQRFNVLVCSTIIETGIDIPTANTIIIEGADKFGLAQLHQLRGRVGRSHHQAYAYMLTPPPKLITKDAQKRLEAIANLDTLGAGFLLATQDLEIRGAGELLGNEQSGQMESIGFGLYMEMLEKSVTSLREGKEPSLMELTAEHSEIDLQLNCILPEDYMGDVNLRLDFYKRIASAKDNDSLNAIKIELVDRFGLLPLPTQNLFLQSQLRQQINSLGVKGLYANAKGGLIEFYPTAKLDPMRFLKLIQENPQVFRFDGEHKFRFNIDLSEASTRIDFVQNLIVSLQE